MLPLKTLGGTTTGGESLVLSSFLHEKMAVKRTNTRAETNKLYFLININVTKAVESRTQNIATKKRNFKEITLVHTINPG